jgi:hypothetical protein
MGDLFSWAIVEMLTTLNLCEQRATADYITLLFFTTKHCLHDVSRMVCCDRRTFAAIGRPTLATVGRKDLVFGHN